MIANKPSKMAHVKVLAEVPADDGDGQDNETAPDDYELDDAARTLQRADEIRKDPRMMKHLKPHLQKKAKTYRSLAQLRAKGAALKAQGK